MNRKLLAAACSMCLASAICVGALAEDAKCFLRNGERWLTVGDSITANGTYTRTIVEVYKHFHPESEISVSGMGVGGVPSNYRFSIEKEKPTVVSIMLGMNDVIHYGYKQRDIEKIVDAYRKNITAQVKQFKEAGADVVLMTPTLTDEAFSRGFWELRGSRDVLRKFGAVIKEIAEQEKVFFIPVQEELDAYHMTREPIEPLCPDGVHPSAAGQYQIARTFWEHMNFPGKMIGAGEARSLSKSFKSVPVQVSLKGKFITSEHPRLNLSFKSEKPEKIHVCWNLGKASGKADIDVEAKGTDWSPELPAEALDIQAGESRQLIFDLEENSMRSLYIVDLTRNPVLHFKDNKMSGELSAEQPRPEGKTVTTWSMEKIDNGLLLSGEVFDNDIESLESEWPWGRDGISLWLDLRAGDRYGGIGLDEDVFQSILNVQEKPAFSCHLAPWLGRGMGFAANVGGSKTDKGWKWNMFVNHNFLEKDTFNIKEHDFVGFNLVYCDEDKAPDGKRQAAFHVLHKTERPMDILPSGMMIVDVNGKLKDQSVTVVNLWGR